MSSACANYAVGYGGADGRGKDGDLRLAAIEDVDDIKKPLRDYLVEK
jgi:hypothetical protein